MKVMKLDTIENQNLRALKCFSVQSVTLHVFNGLHDK